MKKPLLIIGIIILVIILCVGGYILLRHPSPIPGAIRKQVNFGIYYPKPSDVIKLQTQTFKYDAPMKQVSFIVHYNGRNITFSEQSSPETFADDPSFYTKFLDKLGKYAAFDCLEGTVNLARPTKTSRQTAIMNAKGTLTFALSDKDLTTDQWRLLFNSLKLSTP